MKWSLCSSELDRCFVIKDEQGYLIAFPVTQKAQGTANWHNKKLRPITLWKQVTTPAERRNVRLLTNAPELLDTLKYVLACLEDWVEIADDEDQRESDHKAIRWATHLIQKIEKGS